MTSCAAFLVALQTRLEARFASGEYAGVAVHLVPPGDTPLSESVVLVWRPIDGLRDWAAMGVHGETWRIPGRAYAKANGPDTSTVFQEAIERADGIVAQVQAELDPHPPDVGLTMDASVADTRLVPVLLDPGGWGCEAEFTIELGAQVTM